MSPGADADATRRTETTGAACCERPPAIDESVLTADVRVLDAISNETRYETLRLIAAAGDEGICGCELQPSLGVSQGAVSQAVSRLHTAGLVARRKEGRWRYYSATGRAERLLAALEDIRTLDDD